MCELYAKNQHVQKILWFFLHTFSFLSFLSRDEPLKPKLPINFGRPKVEGEFWARKLSFRTRTLKTSFDRNLEKKKG